MLADRSIARSHAIAIASGNQKSRSFGVNSIELYGRVTRQRTLHRNREAASDGPSLDSYYRRTDAHWCHPTRCRPQTCALSEPALRPETSPCNEQR